MKKFLALTMAMAMVLGLAACGNSSSGSSASTGGSSASQSDASTGDESTGGGAVDLSDALVEPGKLIMSTNAAFPPYEMVADGEGVYQNLEGIDIEIAVAIADKLDLELVIDDMDFDAALMAVQNNAADVMLAGLSYREDRDEVVDFTDSYATGIQVVIVKEGSEVTLDNVGEYMIGTQRGTTGFQYATEDYGQEHVTGYDNGATAVQELNNGQVDCVVIDNAPAKEFIAANPGLKLLDTAYVEESYAIGVGKGNTELKDAINTALEELKADGTLQTIVDKYITAD